MLFGLGILNRVVIMEDFFDLVFFIKLIFFLFLILIVIFFKIWWFFLVYFKDKFLKFMFFLVGYECGCLFWVEYLGFEVIWVNVVIFLIDVMRFFVFDVNCILNWVVFKVFNV